MGRGVWLVKGPNHPILPQHTERAATWVIPHAVTIAAPEALDCPTCDRCAEELVRQTLVLRIRNATKIYPVLSSMRGELAGRKTSRVATE